MVDSLRLLTSDYHRKSSLVRRKKTKCGLLKKD